MEQTHTTSDLLRLLGSDGRPCSEVAAAVAQRYGGDAASQAWLRRTLGTLLRDGLLYSQAEKMNAAYLLQLVASDATAGRDQLPAPLDIQERLGAVMPPPSPPPQAWPCQPGQAAETLPALHAAAHGASLQPQPPPWTQQPQPAPHAQHALQDLQQQQQQQPADRAMLQQGPQQQQEVAPEQQPGALHLEQAREEGSLDAALAALQEATLTPLIPSRQQELVRGLQSPQGAALAARLAGALDGGGGGGDLDLQPGDMGGLTEHNSILAAEVLLALTQHAPDAAAVYAAAVAELPMSQQSVECLSTVVSRAELPDWVVATLLSNCMQAVNANQDAGRQSRQVRLLCACVALVLQRQPAALAESLPELLSFCIQQSRHKPAAELYRHLRDLEQAVS